MIFSQRTFQTIRTSTGGLDAARLISGSGFEDSTA